MGDSVLGAALPPFPFPGFDPLHPDPTLLPQIGAYFTGMGDPRPALHTLTARLQSLGEPANRSWWSRFLHARGADLTVRDRQDAAALASYAPGFVRSARDASAAFRRRDRGDRVRRDPLHALKGEAASGGRARGPRDALTSRS